MNIDSVIIDDWASEPDVMQACLHVWHALSSRKHQSDHYDFAELAELAQVGDESEISKALLYLASPKLKVFKTCLMYEFNGYFLELPEEEVSHFSKGEAVIHPELGDPLPKSEILLCFVPSVRLQREGVT